MSDVAAVVEHVRERIDPDDDERARLEATTAELVERVRAALSDLPVTADVLRVGSTARGTWLAGDRDIDLFVRFPTDIGRERLKEYGLRVGRDVLPDGTEQYAEHPYVTGEVNGFDVDVVPCYDVPESTDVRTAVDRTPFHNDYLRARLDDELAAEVRVFKRFLKGIGAYGSDLKTRGFSGYLSELLVLEYDGFDAVLCAAAEWNPPVRFDPEDHGIREFDDPLVVVDPTDPNRNVAAVCSAENVARVEHYARDFLANPREEVFFPSEPTPLSAGELLEHVDRRGTTPVAVVFDTPNVVDDQLYPQLRKSLNGVADELDRQGFVPIRATTFAGDRSVLFVELAVSALPSIERHGGPPVSVRSHAAGFVDRYVDADVYGPYLDGDRYVVEREREYDSAIDLLRSDAIFDVALGAHVERVMRSRGYDVLVGDEVAALVGNGADAETFGVEFARYFAPRP